MSFGNSWKHGFHRNISGDFPIVIEDDDEVKDGRSSMNKVDRTQDKHQNKDQRLIQGINRLDEGNVTILELLQWTSFHFLFISVYAQYSCILTCVYAY